MDWAELFDMSYDTLKIMNKEIDDLGQAISENNKKEIDHLTNNLNYRIFALYDMYVRHKHNRDKNRFNYCSN